MRRVLPLDRLAKAKHMEKMTETEVKAEVLGIVLQKEPTSFGQEQAELAFRRLRQIEKAEQADEDTIVRVQSWLGNHSAIRQWAIKQSLMPASTVDEDALAKACKKVISRLDAALENADKK